MKVLIPEMRASIAPLLSSEEPPGAGPGANKVASGSTVYTPSRICGVFGVGPDQEWGEWLLAQLERAVPASVLERKGILEMAALGTQAPSRKGERMRFWCQAQALIAVLSLTSTVTLGKLLKPS